MAQRLIQIHLTPFPNGSPRNEELDIMVFENRNAFVQHMSNMVFGGLHCQVLNISPYATQYANAAERFMPDQIEWQNVRVVGQDADGSAGSCVVPRRRRSRSRSTAEPETELIALNIAYSPLILSDVPQFRLTPQTSGRTSEVLWSIQRKWQHVNFLYWTG